MIYLFTIYDGRKQFYQWDLDRKLVVEDSTIKEVHFCNKTDDCSLVVETYTEDGLTLANVPNVLLQSDWRVNVYAYDGKATKHSATFGVISRTKPSDYIYTETELKSYEDFRTRLEDAEYRLDVQGAYIAVAEVAIEENKERLNALENEPKYELIQTIILDEEVSLVKLEGYALEEFTLYIEVPTGKATAGATLYFYKNNNTVWTPWAEKMVNSGSITRCALYAKNERGLGVMEYTNPTSSTATTLFYINRAPFYTDSSVPFSGVGARTSSATIFPVGTKFELWGVRANA